MLGSSGVGMWLTDLSIVAAGGCACDHCEGRSRLREWDLVSFKV